MLRRRLYKCGKNFVTLEQIPTWSQFLSHFKGLKIKTPIAPSKILNDKISLFKF